MIVTLDTTKLSNIELGINMLILLRRERFGLQLPKPDVNPTDEEIAALARSIHDWMLEHSSDFRKVLTVQQVYEDATKSPWTMLTTGTRKSLGRVFSKLAGEATEKADVGNRIVLRDGKTVQNFALYRVTLK